MGGAATFVAVVVFVDCHAELHVGECERLQHYSCDCFGGCQNGDLDAIRAGDPDRCNAQLREDFQFWQVCASGIRATGERCDANCMVGWGACAFEAYQEVGMAPSNMCPSDGGE